MIRERTSCSNSTIYKHKTLWHPDFDDKTCVICSTPIDTDISTNARTENAAESCVTAHMHSTSDDLVNLLDVENISETPDSQEVTHQALLSVNSSVGRQAEESCNAYRVGDVVRWKQTGEQVRVTDVEPNGTIWVKRINHPVALTSIVLKVDQVEWSESNMNTEVIDRWQG